MDAEAEALIGGKASHARARNRRDNHPPEETHDISGVAGQQLKAYLERIERLEEEKKGIADDIKDVYAEAKGNGFDVKVMKKLISIRKQDVEQRQEEEAILELYMQALGMLGPSHGGEGD